MDYYKPPHKRRHGKSDDFKDEPPTRHRNKQRKSESSSKRKSVLSPGHLKGISNQADVMSNIRCKIFSILGHEGGGTTQGKRQSRSPQASSDRDSDESIDEKLNGNTAKKLLGNTERRISWNNDRKSPENNGKRLSRMDDRKSSRNTYKKSSGNTYRKSTGNMRKRTPSWERSLSPSSDEEVGCCHNDRLVDPPSREWVETKKSKFRDRKSWNSRRDSGNIRLERVIYNSKLNEANQSFDESKLSRYHRSCESTHEVMKPDHVIRDTYSRSHRTSFHEPSKRPTDTTYHLSNELKFNLTNRFDHDALSSTRNVLRKQMASSFPFIDTHCHIDFLFKRLNYRNKFTNYVEEAFFKFPDNYEGCIADWCQPSLYRTAADILENTSSNPRGPKIWGAFGCHPHFVKDYDDFVEKQIEHHFNNYKNVIAYGEMGLDYSDRFGPTDHELQKKVFIEQLKQSRRYQVPLVIHCRDADVDLFKIMSQYVHHTTAIHRHCLTTDLHDVEQLLGHFPNLYVGFTNLITNKSAYKARGSAGEIPLERIVLETDCPYFIPSCVSGASKGAAKYSHPGMASSVACEIASLKGIQIDDVLTQVRANVKHLYDI